MCAQGLPSQLETLQESLRLTAVRSSEAEGEAARATAEAGRLAGMLARAQVRRGCLISCVCTHNVYDPSCRILAFVIMSVVQVRGLTTVGVGQFIHY